MKTASVHDFGELKMFVY